MAFSRFNFTVFFTEAIFYITAFSAAILSVLKIKNILWAQEEIARRMAAALPGSAVDLPPDLMNLQNLNSPEIITMGQFLISFLIATAFFLILLKTKYGSAVFRTLFVLAIFAGTQVIFRIWLIPELSILFAFILTAARFLFPVIIVHNLVIIAAITGIAVNLAVNIKPSEAIFLLTVISVYDFIAVYVTRHMVKMFKSTVSLGTVFAMVIPESMRHFIRPLPQVQPREKGEFIYLGGGDLAFPLIFVVSIAAKIGAVAAIYASAGAILGLLVLNILFMMQKERRPMPGMPLLAAFSILGFLASLIKF